MTKDLLPTFVRLAMFGKAGVILPENIITLQLLNIASQIECFKYHVFIYLNCGLKSYVAVM